MADIDISVAAPGATKAAQELMGAAQATRQLESAQKAAAAAEKAHLDKLNETRRRLEEFERLEARIAQAQQQRAAKALALRRQALQSIIDQRRAEAQAEQAAANALRDQDRATSRAISAGQGGGGQGGGLSGRRAFGAVAARFGFGGVGEVVGALGPVGAAAGALLVLGRVISGLSEQATDSARRIADARLSLNRSIASARETAGRAGVATLERERGALARIAGTGDNVDRRRVEVLNAEGFTGAASAVASLMDVRDPDARATVLETAKRVARFEGISLDEAVKAVRGGGRLRGTHGDRAASVINKMRGNGRHGGVTGSDVDATMDALATGANGGRVLSDFDRIRGELEAAGRSRIGEAPGLLSKDLQKITDPEMAVMAEWRKAKAEEIAAIRAQAEAQWKVVALWRDMLHVAGMSDGSFRTQADRAFSEGVQIGGGR